MAEAPPRRPETTASDLYRRLAEAEETLRAIREGEVDALVMRGSRPTRCSPSADRTATAPSWRRWISARPRSIATAS